MLISCITYKQVITWRMSYLTESSSRYQQGLLRIASVLVATLGRDLARRYGPLVKKRMQVFLEEKCAELAFFASEKATEAFLREVAQRTIAELESLIYRRLQDEVSGGHSLQDSTRVILVYFGQELQSTCRRVTRGFCQHTQDEVCAECRQRLLDPKRKQRPLQNSILQAVQRMKTLQTQSPLEELSFFEVFRPLFRTVVKHLSIDILRELYGRKPEQRAKAKGLLECALAADTALQQSLHGAGEAHKDLEKARGFQRILERVLEEHYLGGGFRESAGSSEAWSFASRDEKKKFLSKVTTQCLRTDEVLHAWAQLNPIPESSAKRRIKMRELVGLVWEEVVSSRVEQAEVMS